MLQKIARDPNDPNYPEHKDRAEFYLKRTPEELYDAERDPGCLHNLINDPAHRQLRAEFRTKMEALLVRTQDSELPQYQAFLKQAAQ